MSTISEYTTLYSPSELREAARQGLVAVDGYPVSELIIRALEGMVEWDPKVYDNGYSDGWRSACEHIAGRGL